jgi:hypothetical protein
MMTPSSCDPFSLLLTSFAQYGPLETDLENWGYGGPKSQRKDTRQRWLFVAGLPVTAVGSIEQRVSIFLEPDSDQGMLCVMAMMYNIRALSGGWGQYRWPAWFSPDVVSLHRLR